MSEVKSSPGKLKIHKKGIVYLSTIPPFMNVSQVTEIMSQFGKVGRVFLQPATLRSGVKKKKTRSTHFTEGWVEFLSKRVAKEVARTLNNTQISSQKKSRYFDHMWNIKYLSHFKWIHLSERLEYERAVYKQRMRTEIAQAKREANHFSRSVELSEKQTKKLKHQKQMDFNSNSAVMQYKQRKTNDEIQRTNETKDEDRIEFLKGLFRNSIS
ncbi:uncharacterized protein LOC142324859 [Lycorma delicatula]|uniref:uncharacterized protein LOC142324859 n=1 Tax=Lycorma delicatula TaxID=130591 RepID=UPI003F5162C6